MGAGIGLHPKQLGRDSDVATQDDHWRSDAQPHDAVAEGRGCACVRDFEQNDSSRHTRRLLHCLGQRWIAPAGYELRHATRLSTVHNSV